MGVNPPSRCLWHPVLIQGREESRGEAGRTFKRPYHVSSTFSLSTRQQGGYPLRPQAEALRSLSHHPPGLMGGRHWIVSDLAFLSFVSFSFHLFPL